MRVRLLDVELEAVSLPAAVDQVMDLVDRGQGGLVVTLNVDQAVLLQKEAGLRTTYDVADLVYADGMPLVWLSRLLRRRLPGRVTGSDLAPALLARAADEGRSVHLVGGMPEAALRAREHVLRLHPDLRWTGEQTPDRGFEHDPKTDRAVATAVAATNPDLVLMCLGTPKQEEWALRHRDSLPSSVLVCVGAAVDFLGGTVRRAPPWMQRAGLEWAYRLVQEPRRLWRRYLVQDLAFLRLAVVELRTWRRDRSATPDASI